VVTIYGKCNNISHIIIIIIIIIINLMAQLPQTCSTKPQLHAFSTNCQVTKLNGILRNSAEGQAITSRNKLGYLLPFLFTRAHQWSPSQNKIRPYNAQYTRVAKKDKGHALHFLYRL
jgi:hypothetical protein